MVLNWWVFHSMLQFCLLFSITNIMSLNIQSKKYNVTASISFHDLLSKFIPRSDSASLVCKDRGEHTIKPLEQFPSDRWDQGEDVRPSIMHSGTFGENQTLRISTNSHRDQSQHRLNLSEILWCNLSCAWMKAQKKSGPKLLHRDVRDW